MVVSPDYQGLGVSEKRPQAYLGHTINAAQCIDGLKAAYSYMEQEKIKMKEGYSTLISGYSQGGGQALACQRHIETICIQKERDLNKIGLTIVNGICKEINYKYMYGQNMVYMLFDTETTKPE
jgi:hypothetical protein